MSIHTQKIVEVALVSLRAPMLQTCPCCGGSLHADDFPNSGDYTTETAIITRYGSMICNGCAGEHHACETCGKATTEDDDEHSYAAWDGVHFCTHQCRDAYVEAA